MNKSVSIHQKHLQPLITDMYKLHAGLAIGIMVPFRLKQKVLKTFLLIVKGIVLLLLLLLAQCTIFVHMFIDQKINVSQLLFAQSFYIVQPT